MLPPTIGKLAALTYLNLYDTKVSGKFGGVVIGPLFIILSVGSDRDLNGPFHSLFSDSCCLHLFLTRTGVLPAELGKLTKLTYMNFYDTKVSGKSVGRCDWSIFHNYQSAPAY